MFKTIKINDLQPENISRENRLRYPYDQYWLRKIKYGSDSKHKNDYKVQYSLTNGPASLYSENAVLQSFFLAYNRHEDIILSPDDLWLLISINFSKYVNSKSEQLRHILVDHEGKKKLVIVEPIGKSEEDWTDFFGKMQAEISKNVKGTEVIDNLMNNFSTTTDFELILSHVCIMNTFKAYFDYCRMIPLCGIRNVHFMGTLSDWKLLKQKAEQLMRYTIQEDEFYCYIKDILPILNEFIETYQGKVDVEFWNRIINLKSGLLGSGSTQYITGWILKLFYGINQNNSNEIEFSDVCLDSIHVPVEIENYATGLKKTCYVLGGFHGVDSTRDHMHRPVMSLAVIEDLTTVRNLVGERKPE